jgi:hypothetical protein
MIMILCGIMNLIPAFKLVRRPSDEPPHYHRLPYSKTILVSQNSVVTLQGVVASGKIIR